MSGLTKIPTVELSKGYKMPRIGLGTWLVSSATTKFGFTQ